MLQRRQHLVGEQPQPRLGFVVRQVAEGERYLHEVGFKTVRVRHHGQLARLEVAPDEIEHLTSLRQQVSDYFKTLGFHYVAADLTGYRLGSLNEVLK